MKIEVAWKCPRCGKSHGWDDQQLVWVRYPHDCYGVKLEVKGREYVDILEVEDVRYYCRACGCRVPAPWATIGEDNDAWG